MDISLPFLKPLLNLAVCCGLCLNLLGHYYFQCVAVDAVVETDLVSALKVSVFPEIIFTKAGKILYREKGIVRGNLKPFST